MAKLHLTTNVAHADALARRLETVPLGNRLGTQMTAAEVLARKHRFSPSHVPSDVPVVPITRPASYSDLVLDPSKAAGADDAPEVKVSPAIKAEFRKLFSLPDQTRKK